MHMLYYFDGLVPFRLAPTVPYFIVRIIQTTTFSSRYGSATNMENTRSVSNTC